MNKFTMAMATSMLLLCALLTPHANANSAKLDIEFTLADLDVQPYHRPYVAIWLETPERKHVTTIALWVEKAEWFKDLRQWWRKAGRSNHNFDGVTGATKRPGTYSIHWQGDDQNGNPVKPGTYLLNVEVVREEGGRDYTRLEVDLTKEGKLTIAGEKEFSTSYVTISSNS